MNLSVSLTRISPAEHEELMRHVPKDTEDFRDILDSLRPYGPDCGEPYITGKRTPGEPPKIMVNRDFLHCAAITLFVRNIRSHDALSLRSALYHEAKFGKYWLK